MAASTELLIIYFTGLRNHRGVKWIQDLERPSAASQWWNWTAGHHGSTSVGTQRFSSQFCSHQNRLLFGRKPGFQTLVPSPAVPERPLKRLIFCRVPADQMILWWCREEDLKRPEEDLSPNMWKLLFYFKKQRRSWNSKTEIHDWQNKAKNRAGERQAGMIVVCGEGRRDELIIRRFMVYRE